MAGKYPRLWGSQASCCGKTEWLAGKYQEGKAAVPPPGIINTQENDIGSGGRDQEDCPARQSM